MGEGREGPFQLMLIGLLNNVGNKIIKYILRKMVMYITNFFLYKKI